jgi:hypothetical protein
MAYITVQKLFYYKNNSFCENDATYFDAVAPKHNATL